MATSSIFTNFTINDEKSAEKFADVLDKAAQQPAWEASSLPKPPLRDHEAIRALVAKRVKTNE